jgi:hypothetical protein
MNPTATPASLIAVEERRDALFGTLPLLVLVAFLFAAAAVIFVLDRTLGPSLFPLWLLFIVLATVATVGALVSGLYAEDRPMTSGPEPREAPPAPTSGGRDWRTDFGRPVPEVVKTRRSPAAPWDEDAIATATPRSAPAPDPPPPDPSSDVTRALDEIAQIQRELMTRRPSKGTPATDPAARP